MRHEILGINVLIFVLVVWLWIVIVAWIADNLPEIYVRWKMMSEAAEVLQKDRESELTVEMPAGSFDPDETMQLAIHKYRTAKIEELSEIKGLFVIDKRHAPAGRRRHAKA